MNGAVKADSFTWELIFFPRPEATIAISRENEFFTSGGNEQELVLAYHDTEVVKPGVIGAIMAGIAFPLGRNLEGTRPSITLARIPVAAVENVGNGMILTMKMKRKQSELGQRNQKQIRAVSF